MKYLIVVLVLIFIYIIIRIIIKIKQDKDIYKLLKNNEKEYQLIKVKKKAYDYVLRFEDIDVYLCVLKIPKYSQICINSKDTWKLSYNTFKQDKGKAYSNSRYLDEIKYFLKNDIESKKNYLKLVFVYKRYDEIVRYLNETELDVIDFNKSPYGYKITSYDNFIKDLEILSKK